MKIKNKKLMKSIRDAHKAEKKKHKKHEKHEKHKKHEPSHKKHEKKSVKEAMRHKDVLGAGAKKRKKLKAPEKVETVMKEFKRGTLHSGSGAKVTNPKQAIAIGLSEARRGKKR